MGPVVGDAGDGGGHRGRRRPVPRDRGRLRDRGGAVGARADPAGHAARAALAAVRQARPQRGRRGAGQAGARMTAEASVRPIPPPEPLPADAFDSHCHLDLIDRPVPEILADARAARITRVVTIGVDLPTSRWAAAGADAHRDVYAAVAGHPNETARATQSPAVRGPADPGSPGPGPADPGPANR